MCLLFRNKEITWNELEDLNMLDLLLNRRSCRNFNEKAVEEDKIQKILMAAQLAPSGKNTRPWEFVVIRDKKTLNDLGNCRKPIQAFLPEAPLAIVVLGNTDKTDTWIEDASITSTFMQLEAEVLGLGSCWVQIRMRESNQGISSEDYIRNLLNIPDYLSVLCIIGIGYPKTNLDAHSIEEYAKERVHFEKY